MKKKDDVVQQPTPTREDVQQLANTIRDQHQTILVLEEAVKNHEKFEEGAKKLLFLYDSLDDGEYLKFLDSFVLAACTKFSKDMTTDEKLSLRQDMKDFIESRMTEPKK